MALHSKFFQKFHSSAILVLALWLMSCSSREARPIIIDYAGEERALSIVSFQLKNSDGKNFSIKNSEGDVFPVQQGDNGVAWAVLTGVKAEQVNGWELIESDDMQEGIQFSKEDNHVSFFQNGNPVFYYQTTGALPGPEIDSVYLRGGYIHPVFTPEEVIITDDYAHNHLHHHGIWAAWTKTVFEGRTPDFWNMGERTGTVEFVSLDSVWAGPVMGGFISTHSYIDLTVPERKEAIKEKWKVSIFNTQIGSDKYYLFDVDIQQDCATQSLLFLPEYHYGGIGFRGHESWNGEGNTHFLSSEGILGSQAHATKARWCHIGGLINGMAAGVTIMNHPENFRAPQPMRVHPSEPFFCYAPSQGGDWSINPGDTYHARYRFVVYDGEPDIPVLEALYKDYENPLKIAIGRH